ncbi:acetoin utilization protein AcuC [Alkalibacter rhizosphaerae]|uniref:Acetoin utilization protein AcuC n=1 Tax=Alkalibacter rhizosphaerae TaxID=2815577 RepID=A0A974XFU1_9FIRM|nr:acetoin utilization protein AcuC [Alkalibacter rhizosphaerae]QSX09072.1 acetoin utilization protein AcuC [Alkalibacter rhizosphaerae]
MAHPVTSHPIFIYSPVFDNYRFSHDHPFDPIRIRLTYELLRASGILQDHHLVDPREASVAELLLAHREDYVEFVKTKGSTGENIYCKEANRFGLCTEDTPTFFGMHHSAATITGGTLLGAKHVLEGVNNHALNLSGGLHHATSGKASGFCVYNDLNVAIAYIRKHTDLRILYIDTDAHHGDGVQFHFYDDPMVCTLSIHETGRYLFPGTGSVRERGNGKGYGSSFNIPLDAYTEDESFQYVLENSLYIVAEHFKPDIIVSQHGADCHYLDHMSHMSLTMDSFRFIPKIIHKIAHEYCQGRWLATGGGGYNAYDVVPRAWALVWKEMADVPSGQVPDELPGSYLSLVRQWTDEPICPTWMDHGKDYNSIPRREEISDKNKKSLIDAMYAINSGQIGNNFFANRIVE